MKDGRDWNRLTNVKTNSNSGGNEYMAKLNGVVLTAEAIEYNGVKYEKVR